MAEDEEKAQETAEETADEGEKPSGEEKKPTTKEKKTVKIKKRKKTKRTQSSEGSPFEDWGRDTRSPENKYKFQLDKGKAEGQHINNILERHIIYGSHKVPNVIAKRLNFRTRTWRDAEMRMVNLGLDTLEASSIGTRSVEDLRSDGTAFDRPLSDCPLSEGLGFDVRHRSLFQKGYKELMDECRFKDKSRFDFMPLDGRLYAHSEIPDPNGKHLASVLAEVIQSEQRELEICKDKLKEKEPKFMKLKILMKIHASRMCNPDGDEDPSDIALRYKYFKYVYSKLLKESQILKRFMKMIEKDIVMCQQEHFEQAKVQYYLQHGIRHASEGVKKFDTLKAYL